MDLQAFWKDKLLLVWCHKRGNSLGELVVTHLLSGGNGFHKEREGGRGHFEERVCIAGVFISYV